MSLRLSEIAGNLLTRRLFSRKAKLLNARMGRGESLDGHVAKGLTLSGLLFADAYAPRIELLIPFEEENDLAIIGNFSANSGCSRRY